MSNARLTLALMLTLAACGDDGSSNDNQTEENPSTAGDGDGDGDGDTNTPDASQTPRDAGSVPRDAGSTPEIDASSPRDAGSTPTVDAGPRDAATPTAVPSFQQVYAIIAANCSPCHTEEESGDLDMSTRSNAFANLVGQDAAGPACGGDDRVRVVPSDAEASLLVQKLEGTQDCGARMPRGRAPLPDASIELIKAWIEGGANND
jgi:hypothetical protein